MRIVRKTIFTAFRLMGFMAVAALAAPTHQSTEYVEGEVIVTFRKSESLATAERALGDHSLKLTKHFTWLSAQRHRHHGLVRSKNRSTAELIGDLKKDPSVELAEPNYLRWPCGNPLPNDPLFPGLWGLQNTGQVVNGRSGTAGADIGFLEAWSMASPFDGGVVVAIIDTGIDYTHPDLVGSMSTAPGEIPNNNLDDDGNGYVDDYYGYNFVDGGPDPMDSDGHGTHVAGTIAAVENNSIGVIGVNYKTRIMALKVSNDGSITSSAEIEAIQYAALMKSQGINLVAINASFAGGGYSATEEAAIESAGDAGIIFCAAAGNDGSDNDVRPVYPASYGLSNMMVVAATDPNDTLAGFSDYGAVSVDLAAPGENILSTLPTSLGTNTRVQKGSTIYTADALSYSGLTTGITARIYDCGLGYATSFPAAVSGNIALIGRGTLYFSDKVANAMASGARAAILYNNISGNFQGTLQYASNWIPAVSISQQDGLALRAALPATGMVVNPDLCYQYLDGTSMATPHVVGAVAFAAMNFSDENVTQRIQRILANVDVMPGLQGKVRTGGRLNIKRIVDTDGNGLPDWWEKIYFGSWTNTNPSADFDKDSAGNWDEWMAGTDPTNANSCLRLAAPLSQNTNGLVVSWQSIQGKTYRLDRATDLSEGFIYTVRTNIPATTPMNTETDTTDVTMGPCFYRVLLQH